MCIMSSAVKSVSNTKIYVNGSSGTQMTVYAMAVQKRSQPVAMILPVPLAAGVSADAIQLLDLSSVPDFFEVIDVAFERSFSKGLKSRGLVTTNFLRVQDVGSYKVSVAPNLEALALVDPSVFVLSPQTQAVLQQSYGSGFAFVVAQLTTNGAYHPLGYLHPLVDDILFVPTKHEHGDTVGDKASWDHKIYHTGKILSFDRRYRETLSDSNVLRLFDRLVEKIHRKDANLSSLLSLWLTPETLLRTTINGMAPNQDIHIRNEVA